MWTYDLATTEKVWPFRGGGRRFPEGSGAARPGDEWPSLRDSCSQAARAPSKFTPEVVDRIVEAVAAGNFIKTAAGLAGIGVSTLFKHKAIAERDLAEGRDTFHARFVLRLDRAQAEAEIRALAVITEAAERSRTTRVRRRARPVLRDGRPVVVADGRGDPVLDHDGRVQYLEHVVTTIETRETKDWRAAAFFLQIRHRSQFGSARRAREADVEEDPRPQLSEEEQRMVEQIVGGRLATPDPIGTLDGLPPRPTSEAADVD